MHEVLLVGFGAMGAMYSMIMKCSGLARVTAVARGNFKAVDANGVHFKSRKYGEITGWRPDRLCSSVAQAADQQYSYVVVTSKAIPELNPTPTMLAPLLSSQYAETYPQPTYVFLQNGLNVERALYDAVKALGKGEPSVISTVAWIGTNMVGENEVEHNDFDRVLLGAYHPTPSPNPSPAPVPPAVQTFHDILAAGGSTMTLPPSIALVKFSKNFWNISMAAFCTLTGYPLPSIFRAPGEYTSGVYRADITKDAVEAESLRTLEGVLNEVLAVGRALGYPDTLEGLPSTLPAQTIANTRALHVKPESTHKPSMLLDAELGRPLEVEAIVGEVVRMARSLGVAVPRIETLYALLLVKQNQTFRKMGL